MPRHKEFEREEVLEKALEVFWCKGYNGASFQALTEGMCINRQSIYDTYGDKHTLYIEALNYYYKKNNGNVAKHFEQPKPVKELFSTFFAGVIADILNDPKRRGCFLVNASLEMTPEDEEVKKISDKSVAELTAVFQKVIAKGIKAGEIASTHKPEALANYMTNIVFGLKTMGKTMHEKKKLQSIADVAVGVLVS